MREIFEKEKFMNSVEEYKEWLYNLEKRFEMNFGEKFIPNPVYFKEPEEEEERHRIKEAVCQVAKERGLELETYFCPDDGVHEYYTINIEQEHAVGESGGLN